MRRLEIIVSRLAWLRADLGRTCRRRLFDFNVSFPPIRRRCWGETPRRDQIELMREKLGLISRCCSARATLRRRAVRRSRHRLFTHPADVGRSLIAPAGHAGAHPGGHHPDRCARHSARGDIGDACRNSWGSGGARCSPSPGLRSRASGSQCCCSFCSPWICAGFRSRPHRRIWPAPGDGFMIIDARKGTWTGCRACFTTSPCPR